LFNTFVSLVVSLSSSAAVIDAVVVVCLRRQEVDVFVVVVGNVVGTTGIKKGAVVEDNDVIIGVFQPTTVEGKEYQHKKNVTNSMML
jgi:hypothetical protein